MPPVAFNVVVLPEQIAVVPAIPVGAVGGLLTVTCLQLPAQVAVPQVGDPVGVTKQA